MPRVNAQQARRILDRLVGYKISPLLWAKVRGGLSAGRVQSVAVRLIVDREREIKAFVPREYWSITARLAKQQTNGVAPVVFPAELSQIDGAKADVADGETAAAVVAAVRDAHWRVSSIKERETRRNAAAPFTTSTLQQEASRKLKFRVRKTMQLAQALYEGVDLGAPRARRVSSPTCAPTRRASRIRPARPHASSSSRATAKNSSARRAIHKLREGAQDAHEAIRPTVVFRTPDAVAGVLKRDELRLYRLIWERFVASQMAPAVFDQTTIDMRRSAATRSARPAACMKFAGFTARLRRRPRRRERAADDGMADGKTRARCPSWPSDEALDLQAIDPKQHFTEPPPRFTEASLVRVARGKRDRPAVDLRSIVETIQARGYVEQVDRRFHPTEIGISVNDLLAEHFPDVVDPKFTAQMEGGLDRVAEEGGDWVALLRTFYDKFSVELQLAEEKLPKFEQRDEPTDEICPTCGETDGHQDRTFREVHLVHGYPECKTTRPILKDTGAKCPKDGGMVVERKSRKGRTFFGCANYPKCDFVSWDRVVPEPCPVCGDYVVVKTRRGGNVSFECHTDKTHDTSALRAAPQAEEAELEPV